MATPYRIMDTLSDNITAAIAPYQPNLVGYPNLLATAGQILSTIVHVGAPVQLNVTNRLEQHDAEIGIVEGATERPMSNYNESEPIGFTSTQQPIFVVGRAIKEFIVEMWAPTQIDVDNLLDVVDGQLGDTFRQTELDQSTSLFRRQSAITFISEQKDSIWISQLRYMVDYAITRIGEGYDVDSFTASVTVVDDVGTTVSTEIIQIT